MVVSLCQLQTVNFSMDRIMNTTLRLLFSFVVIAFCSFAANAQRQTKLYIDDGHGAFSILTAPLGGGAITLPGASITFPSTNAAGVLTNTGTGSLSWTPVSGFTPAYFNAYSTNIQFVPTFSAVSFAFPPPFNVGFIVDPVLNTFTATSAGIYNMEFSVIPNSASTFAITQNGVVLANSQIGCATATTVIHGNAIVSLAAGDVMSLVSVQGTVGLFPSSPGSITASLTAIRIQ
jgi:BclA C-terminal domain